MRRKALPLLALLLVMLLAGCISANEGLEPEVVDVSNPEGDTYRLTVDMTNEHDGTFHDVTLYGYTLNGERVCSAEYGNVTDATKTRTMTCTEFPSLLVPDAEELSEDDFDENPPEGGVSHAVKLYRGYNGSHQFEWFAQRTASPGTKTIGRSLPPDEEVLAAGRCTQWARGEDLSAIGDSPWLDWERHPPRTTTGYSLTVRNVTESRDQYGYTAADVPERTVGRLETVSATNESSRSYELNESGYLEEVSVLADTAISNRSAVADIRDRIDGDVTRHDNTRIACWADRPKHVGETSYRIEVYVRYDGEIWLLELTGTEEHSGPARERDATATPTATTTATATR